MRSAAGEGERSVRDRAFAGAAVFAVLLGLASRVRAADWPCPMGPEGTGVSPETGLLRDWPEAGPRILWTRPVDPNYGAPSIRDGRVYYLDRDEAAWRDRLRCVDLETGRELWTHEYYAYGWVQYAGRGQPVVMDDCVYSMGPFGDLHCVDRSTGRYVWSYNVFLKPREAADLKAVPPRGATAPDLYGTGPHKPPKWGMQRGPVIRGDTVIVAPLSESCGLLALDRHTGAFKWKSPPAGGGVFAHQTPWLGSLAGADQVVLCGNVNMGPPAFLTGFDANSGARLWRLVIRKYNIPIPSPVQVAPDRLYVAGGYGAGARVVAVAATNGAFTASIVYASSNCTPFIQTPVLYRGCLYANSYDEFHNPKLGVENRGLACYNTDGSLRWQSAPERTFDAGPLLIADGTIFVLHGKAGTLHRVDADPDAFRERGAAAKVFDEGADGATARVWSPMALSRGRLVLRDLTHMKCIDVTAEP